MLLPQTDKGKKSLVTQRLELVRSCSLRVGGLWSSGVEFGSQEMRGFGGMTTEEECWRWCWCSHKKREKGEFVVLSRNSMLSR